MGYESNPRHALCVFLNEMGYDTDKIVGIVLIVLSLCGAMCGSLMLGVGALIGGASAGFLPVAAAGGIAAVVGGVILATSLLNIGAGIGIIKSQRWGFLLACVLTGISILAVLIDLSGMSFLALAANAGIFVYCFMRLTGRLGPTPL
ncbi:MAG TPA: hypothetical protein VM328_04620 [Fimbriimonadaceae bacterium]|nr:hypothetical protein [Fimbriimonadaceae bacterium]